MIHEWVDVAPEVLPAMTMQCALKVPFGAFLTQIYALLMVINPIIVAFL